MTAPVAQLCFGAGQNELNLNAVQQRVTDLIRVIDTLLMEMQSLGAYWTSFLDKLAVINITHMQIMSEIRPLLRQYVVYPKFVDSPGIENSIPELLASRLLPEQVTEEEQYRARVPGGLQQLATQPNMVLDYADGQLVELQDLVAWLTNLQHVLKSKDTTQNPTPRDLPVGVLDPKGPLRKQIDANSREIALAAQAATAAREAAGAGSASQTQQQQQQPITAVVVGQKRARPGPIQAAAAAGTATTDSDTLLSKILSGDLWPKENVKKGK